MGKTYAGLDKRPAKFIVSRPRARPHSTDTDDRWDQGPAAAGQQPDDHLCS
jgi:hypothetical protein